MRNIKLTLEYDGTDFCGWQRQANDRTVQAEVERSLSMLTEETIIVTAAGRTDSGVHARGQVINFKTLSELPLTTFVRGGNSRLLHDVRILGAEEVDPDFSARYSAKARLYRYYIAKKQSAVGRQYAWYYWNPLDINEMRAACTPILGSHDFSGFCQSGAVVDHYLCDVRHAWWLENDQFIIFEICANRFLHNMVRILVGTMVKIGEEQSSFKSMAEILASQERDAAGPTAPALGLFLIKVMYD
jgi:tRNA pseudouridine38-40 synthase